jgi:hypothetical protein
MGLPVGQGLSVLYVLADQWQRERQTLAGLGSENPGPLDDLVGRQPAAGAVREDRRGRAQHARELGGEVTISGPQDR